MVGQWPLEPSILVRFQASEIKVFPSDWPTVIGGRSFLFETRGCKFFNYLIRFVNKITIKKEVNYLESKRTKKVLPHVER